MPLNQPSSPLATLKKESDRGCVLVGTAYVEYLMKDAINESITIESTKNPYRDKKMTHGLLKQFFGSARTQAMWCRALGLISDDLYKTLLKLHEFRNKYFAHGVDDIPLSDPQLADQLNGVIAHLRTTGAGQVDVEVNATIADKTKPARERFEAAMFVIICELLSAWARIRDRANGTGEFFIPTSPTPPPQSGGP